jgi:diguanylate cyclase (GGDEF)-like protein
MVAGSLADITTFAEESLRLFQALANHASVSLANVQLVDRLRREATEKEHLALHDPLTGLANRRQFQTLVDEALASSPERAVGIMLMDLDQFKEINDALGHDTGDALLNEVGARLQRRLGARGVVARLGGDEFAVLLPSIGSRADAVAIGEDLTHAMERPVPVGHLMLDARASIGIAFAPEHGDNANTLIQRADVAMYAAKKARSGTRVYQPEDDQNTPTRLAFIADLRTAIQRGELDVVFQPKVDPRTGAVVGAEALSRWHRTGHGFVPPDQFIELAEHSGLIRPLTFQVLETALARCAEWRASGHPLHVAVNLSPSSLVDRTLSDTVARLLVQAGLPASALTLEITESSIMADPARSLATLESLHALGVKLSIDDFGTGYSSLGRLRTLPIQEVKIDKSFVQRLTVDASDEAVAHSAIQLGHALGLQVVAEGVEDAETCAHLANYGCNVVQGYYISKPVDHDSLMIWLAERAASSDPKVVYPRFGT